MEKFFIKFFILRFIPVDVIKCLQHLARQLKKLNLAVLKVIELWIEENFLTPPINCYVKAVEIFYMNIKNLLSQISKLKSSLP